MPAGQRILGAVSLLLILLGGVVAASAEDAPPSPVHFRKIVLTTQFYSEGANVGDFTVALHTGSWSPGLFAAAGNDDHAFPSVKIAQFDAAGNVVASWTLDMVHVAAYASSLPAGVAGRRPRSGSPRPSRR